MDLPSEERTMRGRRAAPSEPNSGARTAKQEQAYMEAVRKHYTRIYAFLFHLSQDRSAAEDLTQETYSEAWRRLDQFRGQGSAYVWLHQIALNAFRQHRRAAKPENLALNEEIGTVDDPSRDILARAEAELEQSIARQAVSKLPDIYREAIILKCYQGLRYKDISGLLGVPQGTVQSRVKTGIDMLRARLRDNHQGDTCEYEKDLR